MSRHCVSVLLLIYIAQACLAFAPSWTATFRSSRLQPPPSTPAATTCSLSQPSGATCPVFGACGTCGAQMFYPVRGMTSLSAMSEGDEEEGGGDHDAREAADRIPAADEIRAVQDEIRGVERKIEGVEEEMAEVVKKIDGIEAAIAGGPRYLGMTDPEALLKQLGRKEDEKEQLRREKEQLRRKEEQLRELLLKKEDRLSRIEQLRANNAPAGWPNAVSEALADFGAVLTEAVVTHNTLELANGTFFFGESSLGSKLFIRRCYEQLAELILDLDAASNGIPPKVVCTGTPGIGKSVFGFYLLYRLRCLGKTVLFELKQFWYRFSDEGVTEGDFSSFAIAGYFKDCSSWYLSDPQTSPMEILSLATVVLVSPKSNRVEQFLKLTKSERFYMGPWGEDELLECRQVVFPHVPETDVLERFGFVGGVARIVFGGVDAERYKDSMEQKATEVNVKLLRQLLVKNDSQLSTDFVSDRLFHRFPTPGIVSRTAKISFASEYAREIVITTVAKQETLAFASFWGTPFTDEEADKSIAGSMKGYGFEEVAHNAIAGAVNENGSDGRTFSMTILGSRSDEVVLTGDSSSFDFTKRREFRGSTIPESLDAGIYYRPMNENFAAIDSFGIDSRGDTLYFFQMKSTGVKAVNGSTVEGYWNTVLSQGVSVKNCVYVFAIPLGDAWEKTKRRKRGDDWLKEASDGFRSTCHVCAIEIVFPFEI